MFKHLGIVIGADGYPVNHRSILKVICNPILRFLGFQIATQFDTDHTGNVMKVAGKVVFHKIDRVKSIRYVKYELKPGEYIIKERIIF